jgi:hypothetical protein
MNDAVARAGLDCAVCAPSVNVRVDWPETWPFGLAIRLPSFLVLHYDMSQNINLFYCISSMYSCDHWIDACLFWA